MILIWNSWISSAHIGQGSLKFSFSWANKMDFYPIATRYRSDGKFPLYKTRSIDAIAHPGGAGESSPRRANGGWAENRPRARWAPRDIGPPPGKPPGGTGWRQGAVRGNWRTPSTGNFIAAASGDIRLGPLRLAKGPQKSHRLHHTWCEIEIRPLASGPDHTSITSCEMVSAFTSFMRSISWIGYRCRFITDAE